MSCTGFNQTSVANRNAASLSPLHLVGPPTMIANHGPDESLSNLTLDDAIAKINQLMAENTQLRETIQKTNESMKMACASIEVLKARVRKDDEDNKLNCNRSRIVVEELRKKLADKDKIIEKLRGQIHEDSLTLESPDQVKQLQAENEQLLHENQILKGKASDYNAVSSEVERLKMQLSNLISENETVRQSSQQEKAVLQQKFQQMLIEQQKKMDSLQSQTERLKNEADSVSKNYEQLMSDYHDLLTSNDQQKSSQDSEAAVLKKDFENRVDNLTAQLVTAEEVLIRKDEQIRTLEQKMNDFEPLQAQVAIYKLDFEAERKSREDLNDRLLELEDKYRRLEDKYHRLEQMHGRQIPPSGVPPRNDQWLKPSPDPEPDLKCPLCNHIAPMWTRFNYTSTPALNPTEDDLSLKIVQKLLKLAFAYAKQVFE